jgi:hypothetical protein
MALFDDLSEPFRYIRPARAYADKHNLIETVILLRHFSGEALKYGFDLSGV